MESIYPDLPEVEERDHSIEEEDLVGTDLFPESIIASGEVNLGKSDYSFVEDLAGLASSPTSLVASGEVNFEKSDRYVEEADLAGFEPFPRFLVASGEVNFEYPDPVERPDISSSTVNMPASTTGDAAAYNAARASKDLTLLVLPRDVRNKIYAMCLGPTTEVAIQSFVNLPKLFRRITSPTNLFLVSRQVHREAAAVFYAGTTFRLEHDWGIGYMTGHMGLDNCREIRHFVTLMTIVWNIPLTIRTVFPQLESLTVVPNSVWFCGPWYEHLYKRHGGLYQAAIGEAVQVSQARAAIGFREILEMSRHYTVLMNLPFWNNGDMSRRPVVIKLTMRYPKWTVDVK